MNVEYVSTRDNSDRVSASCAILRGLALDGGLYVPTSIPKLSRSLTELASMDYIR